MTIQEFIEKAIEGEWNKHGIIDCTEQGDITESQIYKIFLDPKAWEAVGKVEGWGTAILDYYDKHDGWEVWKVNMHNMVHHLIEGGDITSYLEKL